MTNHFRRFSDINPEAVVELMSAEYRKVDAVMCFPKNGFPGSRQWYTDCNCRPQVFHLRRFFRNIAAMDKYEALIERLDSFFIAVEYFTGNVQMTRKSGTELSNKFVNSHFCFLLADSYRSTLDIFAKSIAWFFDLPGKEFVGFSHKGLIVPLEGRSKELADACHELRTSPSFARLKALRDTEKHEGHGKMHIEINETDATFDMVMRLPEPLNVDEVEHAACESLSQLLRLLATTSNVLAKWPLGFPSDRDKVAEIHKDGSFWWPKRTNTADSGLKNDK